jgi:hypothetical protein
MPSVIIIEKVGTIKTVTVKTIVETELYKKAGLKTSEGFKCHTNWTVEHKKCKYVISLYGKTTGRSNYENKYEFPPPVDNVLFFGNCILTAKTIDGVFVDLNQENWEKIYETLYGGFEEIGEEDSECESDDDDIVGKRTKNGYVKDGFVVDDDEEDDADEEDGEDDEEDGEDGEDDEEGVYVKPHKKASNSRKLGSAKIKNAFELKSVEDENYLDCTSELSEESYLE